MWAETLENTIQQTPESEYFYILLDVSGDNVTFTQLARNESKRIFTQYKKRQGYIAFLFEWRTSPYFARMFFATIGRLRFKINYFHDEPSAKSWLHEMYNSQKP